MNNNIIRIRCPCCDAIIEFNIETGSIVYHDLSETADKRIPEYLEFGVLGDTNDE